MLTKTHTTKQIHATFFPRPARCGLYVMALTSGKRARYPSGRGRGKEGRTDDLLALELRRYISRNTHTKKKQACDGGQINAELPPNCACTKSYNVKGDSISRTKLPMRSRKCLCSTPSLYYLWCV